MTYADAMHPVGSDKPDLRVKLEFTELTDVMNDVDFKVFSGPANAGRPRGGAARARRRRDEPRRDRRLHRVRQDLRRQGPGLDQGQRRGKGRDGLQSPIVKNLHDAAIAEILKRTGAKDGDLIFFGADKAKIVNDAIGALR